MGLAVTRTVGAEVPGPPATARRGEAGLSLVETVLAALILLLIAVGILPMFTSSMRSNAAGADATYVSNMATERAEEFLQLPFDSEPLRLADGVASRVYNEVYVRESDSKGGEEFWIDGVVADVPAGDTALWTRTTTVEQFSIKDLDSPIPGVTGTDPQATVHIKSIEVDVEGLRQAGPLGEARDLAVQVYKAR